ncbi:hypothetical protein PTSG_11763 [Salpingoeca rosetta]|uniref:TFIIS N-terminal domain-containing protein n=1 Tax=Salpingoeca rosetta (strain ATCC 50818 / BSB-021) TaxID=946362 RepID=F2TYK7_SALR5|nr:uncharacterized protein PTSG_11763 [Salpingoeca rosetta]EGD78681.1 hypothetical protein PTSG_11763 [Salpingoeca rosetta]|eukprot:XP_004997638.1 hypothetical protein PTSG_11763 [Salpingoeca rosetta]
MADHDDASDSAVGETQVPETQPVTETQQESQVPETVPVSTNVEEEEATEQLQVPETQVPESQVPETQVPETQMPAAAATTQEVEGEKEERADKEGGEDVQKDTSSAEAGDAAESQVEETQAPATMDAAADADDDSHSQQQEDVETDREPDNDGKEGEQQDKTKDEGEGDNATDVTAGDDDDTVATAAADDADDDGADAKKDGAGEDEEQPGVVAVAAEKSQPVKRVVESDDEEDSTPADAAAEEAAPAPAETAGNGGDEPLVDKSAMLDAIFGDSDSEEEGTFEGYEEVPEVPSPPPTPKTAPKRKKTQPAKARGKRRAAANSDDEEDNERPMPAAADPFARKKPKRRKNAGIDTNVDDKAKAILNEMKKAADADNAARANRQPALNKLMILDKVVTAINKPQLQPILLDNRLFDYLVLWLQPYEDSTLPNVNVRTRLLRVISTMTVSSDDSHQLRESRLPVVCELLRRHPLESSENKRRLAVIKDKFSRILVSAGELEAQQQAAEEERLRRRMRRVGPARSHRSVQDTSALRPGDKGFIIRARVPQPEDRDYVIRPESKVTQDFDTTARAARSQGRMADFNRMFKSQKNKSKSRNVSAVQVNITGSFSGGK